MSRRCLNYCCWRSRPYCCSNRRHRSYRWGRAFRGGLFFASLLLGALGGRVFAETVNAIWPALQLNPDVYSILGLGALTATIIGAPMAVAFIVLENTGDFWLTAAVFISVIVANLLTRELFGYSFATWRSSSAWRNDPWRRGHRLDTRSHGQADDAA